MEMNSNPSVVFEAENDDDAFYAEIRRQILLLTSEDKDDLLETRGFNTISAPSNGSYNSLKDAVSGPANNFCSWETDGYCSPPVWLVNLWKHGKGTGVFIPQVACRKNHRQGRMNVNNRRGRIYRPVVNKD